MAIASNFPAIRPSLLLDFANSKVLDPRITFGRASAATYYDGKTVAKAEENLLLNSAILATQSVTTRAEPYTLSFIGTGTVTLSGTSTAGPLVGTGAANRVSLTFTPTAGTLTLTVTGAVEQAQLEARSVATAYTPTTTQPITNYVPVLQTAPAGVPRFDHNPLTGESLGLLVEEQRTNLLTYSEQFSNAVWGKTADLSIEYNSAVAPDGFVTATKIAKQVGGSSLLLQHTAAFTPDGKTRAFTIYVKNNGARYLAISHLSSWTTNRQLCIIFDMQTGAYTHLGVTYAGTITPLNIGNGWWRIGFLTDYNASGYSMAGIDLSSNGTFGGLSNYSGSGSAFIWGAQWELGAFPTSYIKTEASQVTRAEDSASMTGTNFSSWYRKDEGTLFADFKVHSNTSSVAGIGGDTFQTNLTFNNQQLVRFAAASPSLTLGTAVDGANRLSATTKNGDYSATVNGQPVTKSSVMLSLPAATVFRIGGAYGGFSPTNGTIKKLSYYPKRLTDAQLQALTA